ncbi:MAG: transglycosylase domain-containing protein [Prosthecobacter sp.]|jgi:membrane peptidoglycan carboxypeptidase|uniref:transglycosylase domain-containing protein n=1 Tax=Prosthecobacter sp. TaxID=1965333 RepID=UPI001A07C15E|nr:transglycosylase domain-containing protein [Prosthecobacter sp.]MBE2287438.1 transglycosylase domain-containing protein [Prosthecobacter sp.]
MIPFFHKLRGRWHRFPGWVRHAATFFIVLASVGLVAFGVVWRHYAGIAATYDMEALSRGQNETLIVDTKGELVGSASDIEREPVSLKDVPQHLVQAVLATEDARFYSHPGYDVVGLVRAAFANFGSSTIRQGGSTITMQLARNAFGLRGRNYERKLTEVFLAMRIERERTKDQILTNYLNRIYLGHGCSGVGAAARCYFGKDVRDISLVEAATLAAIIKAPVTFSPVSQPELARQKRNLTLRRMVETGDISEVESMTGQEQPLVVKYDKTRVRTGYMLAAAREEFQNLGLKPGSPPAASMTMRLDWQHRLDDMMRRHLEALAPDDKDLQGAVIVLDNRSGAILAMQGGRNFTTSPFNRALDGVRPPGIAFLPLVYAAALTLKPDLTDAPFIDGPLDNRQAMIGGLTGALGEWGADGEQIAYDGGTITPLQALLEARTAATVRLGYEVGLDPLRTALMRCGFTDPLRVEAAFTLGQSHLRLIEVARAFTALPNDGRPCPVPHVLLASSSPRGEEVFSPAAAAHVRNTLIAGMTRPEYRQPLVKHKLAQKSIAGFGGITYDRTDAWFIGFDRVRTCLVWIGHDKDIPISPKANAANAALPFWAAVFEMVTEGKPLGWDAKGGLPALLAVPPRALPVGNEIRVPAIKPASTVVIGVDPYRAAAAESP